MTLHDVATKAKRVSNSEKLGFVFDLKPAEIGIIFNRKFINKRFVR